MIDISKCVFTDSYRSDEGHDSYYFDYPTDLTLANFDLEPDDNVVSMCIRLDVFDSGEHELCISPTVEEEDSYVDVDWNYLYENVHYVRQDIVKLLEIVKDTVDYYLVVRQNMVLEDDDTPYGGTSFRGERLCDFLTEVSEDDNNGELSTLSGVNAALKACGIKPVSPR